MKLKFGVNSERQKLNFKLKKIQKHIKSHDVTCTKTLTYKWTPEYKRFAHKHAPSKCTHTHRELKHPQSSKPQIITDRKGVCVCVVCVCAVCCVLTVPALEAGLQNNSVETGASGSSIEHISTSLGHLSQIRRLSPELCSALWALTSTKSSVHTVQIRMIETTWKLDLELRCFKWTDTVNVECINA